MRYVIPRLEEIRDEGGRLLARFRGGRTEALAKDLKVGQPDLSRDERERVLFRGLDLSEPRTFLFRLGGGLGDALTALEAVLFLHGLLKRRGTPHDILILADDGVLPALGPLLRSIAAFRRVVSRAEADSLAGLPLRFPLTVLQASPFPHRADHLSLGSTRDHYLALWGVAARFAPEGIPRGTFARYLRACPSAAQTRARAGVPARARFAVFVASGGARSWTFRNWPAERWRELAHLALAEGLCDHVVLCKGETDRIARSRAPRVTVFDPARAGSDLELLSGMLLHSVARVSVDTGPAHLAGMLGRPAVVLWGPTTPTVHGHPVNHDLRLSSCPPCIHTTISQLCGRNDCMRDIRPDHVIRALLSAAAGRLSS